MQGTQAAQFFSHYVLLYLANLAILLAKTFGRYFDENSAWQKCENCRRMNIKIDSLQQWHLMNGGLTSSPPFLTKIIRKTIVPLKKN